MSEIPYIPCACASLRRASRAVTQLYDDELRPAGLKATQFTVLQVLARVAPVTQARLAEFLALDSTTLSRNVKILEGNGWIQGKEGEDRRERYLSLTRSGRDVVKKGEKLWQRAQDRLREAVGTKAEWKLLFAAADGVVRAARTL